MQVEIKFKRTGSHSVFGNFAAGDVMRCDEALAAFYVKDGVAKYVNAEQPKAGQSDAISKAENAESPPPINKPKRTAKSASVEKD